MILTSSCHYWHKFDDSLVHRSAAQILLRQNMINSNDKTVSESFLLQNSSWVSSLRNILKNQECKIGTYGKCENSRFLSIDMQYQREFERVRERERETHWQRETENCEYVAIVFARAWHKISQDQHCSNQRLLLFFSPSPSSLRETRQVAPRIVHPLEFLLHNYLEQHRLADQARIRERSDKNTDLDLAMHVSSYTQYCSDFSVQLPWIFSWKILAKF